MRRRRASFIFNGRSNRLNLEWENPHEPDGKIGPKKHGGTDMIYKSETLVDLETGAVVQAEVQPRDHTDHQRLAIRIFLHGRENLCGDG